MKLKALLRDDFVDDPGMEPDADYAPVKLPMLTLGYIFSNIFTQMEDLVFPVFRIKQQRVICSSNAKYISVVLNI
jgi:hypothetical protein